MANKTNGIMVVNETATQVFINNDFNKHIQAIAKAQTGVNKNGWTVCEHVMAIIDSKCYEQDFDSVIDLYEFLGISKQTVSVYRKALEYKAKSPEFIKNNNITVKRASIYASLKDKEIDFREWANANNEDTSTDSALQKAKSKFLGSGRKTADKDKAMKDNEPEKVQTGETTLEGAVKVVVIEYKGETLSVPVKVFEKQFKEWSKKYSG